MRIIKKGILTGFYDLGRTGRGAMGIGEGGVMDIYSMKVLNSLLNNPETNPLLEMHFPAPEILFEEKCQFGLLGADFTPFLNQNEIRNGKLYRAEPGDLLRFKKKVTGQICYFGINGDFLLEKWLDSYSQNQFLNYPEFNIQPKINVTEDLQRKVGIPPLKLKNTISFVPEFEFDWLEQESVRMIQTADFKISKDANRMGYKLEGDPLRMKTKLEMISSAVSKGVIQLLPNGQLTILMADAQTTGGYPRLGFIISADFKHLCQKGPNDRINLSICTLEEALEAQKGENAELEKLKTGIKYFG